MKFTIMIYNILSPHYCPVATASPCSLRSVASGDSAICHVQTTACKGSPSLGQSAEVFRIFSTQ